MLYFAQSFLNESDRKDIRKALLMSSRWEDGINTTVGSTKNLKRNLQLISGETYEKYSEYIINEVKNNNNIINYAFPSDVFQILFTRTGVGMFYGPHVDIGILRDGQRRDLSFTIFLNDKNEYKGGELILYIPPETRSIKLNAGDIIIYPTKYLHEVKEVTKGERIVCVGWIESQISRDDDREILGMLKESIGEIQDNPNYNLSTKLNMNTAINRLHKRFVS